MINLKDDLLGIVKTNKLSAKKVGQFVAFDSPWKNDPLKHFLNERTHLNQATYVSFVPT